MRRLSLCPSPIPSSAVLRYLESQLRSDCARPPFVSALARTQRDYHHFRPRTLVSCRKAGSESNSIKTRASWSPWARSAGWQACAVHDQCRPLSTTATRRKPREIAHRNAPGDKWQTRRPPPPPSSPGGFAAPPSNLISDSAPLNASSLSFIEDPSSLIGARLTKPHPDQRLRCTEFDDAGNVTVVNGEFRKSELIQKYGLQPRDLRKIDSSLLPTILVRPRSILLNLLHIRCLIQADRVLVFDAYGSTDSYTQSLFMYDLEGKLSLREGRAQGGLPYEFRALEAVLISVTTALESEFEGVRGPIVKVLRDLEENIDRDKLRMLLVLSKKIGTFEQRARLVRDAIDELLEADDDLAAMYLTEKKDGTDRHEEDHTEVEMLLESYDKVCDEIVQVSGNLVANIRNTEEIVKAILDANRNSLMLLDLKFSIGTLGIGAGTFIAALYGMNLKSFIEEWDFGFPLVSFTCAVFTVIACVYGFRKLRKVQRLSMWGEGDEYAMPSRDGGRHRGGHSAMDSWRTARSAPWRGHAEGKSASTAASEDGQGEWRNMQQVTERIERMERNQWAAAERLRKMRIADRTKPREQQQAEVSAAEKKDK